MQAVEATRSRLQEHLNILHSEALLNRAIFQQGKAAGLAGAVLGGLGCIAFPPLGIIAAVSGAGLWLTTALAEGSITGSLCPLPWVSTRLTDIAAGLDRQNAGSQISPQDLELTDYLPSHDRVTYLLILCQGGKLAEILGQLEPTQVESTFAAIVQRLINVYGRHGMRLEEAMSESEGAIDAIHKEMKTLPPVLTKKAPTITPISRPLELQAEALPVMSKTIGNDTKLAATAIAPKPSLEIDTEDVFASDLWAPVDDTPAFVPSTVASKPLIDPFCDVRSISQTGYVESVIWLGASRSGKTVAADQLFQEYKAKYPGLKAWYITPVYRAGTDANELSLFEGAEVRRYDLLNETNQEIISTCYAEYERVLDDFLKAPSDRQNPKLFINDELSIHRIKAFPNTKTGYQGNENAQRFYGKYINGIAANASGGKAVGISLWGIAPIGAVGGLGIEQYALSAITPVFVAHVDSWNGAVWQGAKRNNLAPEREPSEDLKRNVRGLGGDRIVSIGCADWRPLKNYAHKAQRQRTGIYV